MNFAIYNCVPNEKGSTITFVLSGVYVVYLPRNANLHSEVRHSVVAKFGVLVRY